MVMRYVARRPELPSREELLAQGLTPAQVDHEMVRRHELEVIEENFTRWVMAWCCIVCMLLPVRLGLMMFLVYGYVAEKDKECDVPLDAWFIVAMANIVYNINLNGKSVHQQFIRVVCRYEALGRRLEPPPLRVRVYHRCITGFVFAWYCLGLHWCRTARSCRETAPDLFQATYMLATFSIVFTIFTTLSTFGLSHMLASLLRRGLLPAGVLPSERAAPQGTLESQETVVFDVETLRDSPQCPTCLEDFANEQGIKRTVCGHFFHEDCLAPWLRVNRTCPLCRTDLASGLGGLSEGETIGAAEDAAEQGEATSTQPPSTPDPEPEEPLSARPGTTSTVVTASSRGRSPTLMA